MNGSKCSKMISSILVFRFVTAILHLHRYHRLRQCHFLLICGFLLDDFQFSAQNVTEHLVPSSVFPIWTPQAVSVVWVYLTACVDGRLSYDFSFGLNTGPEKNRFRLIYLPSCVFTVRTVQFIALCTFFRSFLETVFCCSFFSTT